MLQLVTLPPAFGLRNVSPFCLKIELLLTALDVPFQHRELADPRKAPKGKLPFIVTDDGQDIADSELITEYLNELTQGRVYEGLSPQQKAHGVALARLAEDHLYWIMVASRWLDDTWWPHVYRGFFGALPPVIRNVAGSVARRQMRQTYQLHGLGRHTQAEQEGFARRDFAALQDAVADSTFLFGETPNIYDFTVAGMMPGMLDAKPDTWLSPIAREYPRLQAYTEAVQEHVGVFGRDR